MSFRAKCSSCGRKQSAELSEVGKVIFCAACGHRFVVEFSEPDRDESTLPDVDFAPPARLPEPPTLARNGILEESAPPQVPHPLPNWPSLPVEPPPASAVTPEIFTPPQSRNWVPLVILLGVLGLGVAMAVGIGIGYAMGRSSNPVAISTPTPPPARKPAVPATSPPPLQDKIAEAAPPVKAVIEPTTNPIAVPAPAVVEIAPPPPTPIVPAKFQPVRPPPTQDLDDRIGTAINRGVSYLLSECNDGRLKRYNPNNPPSAGMDALAVYALLHAAEATHDLRLGPNTPLVASLLDNLKKMPMDREDSTYSRSLRAAALGVYHRAEDKTALREDCAWLVAAANNGAYTYDSLANRRMPPGNGRFGGWDNSNSQYGALGVWAALEAGVEVQHSFWTAVQKHWLSCQLPDGEWGYSGYGSMGRLSMTVAGITTLLVTEDQLDARAVVSSLGHQPFTPALQRGLNWLEAGDNAIRLPRTWRTYNLFGLERAALASGFKYFGDHDWYRELAIEQLSEQGNDGSWMDYDPVVGTSYTLLFLSRGRHPIFMNKLRFDGFWANRPRDIANLAHYASTVLERPINWQVVSFKSDWTDWMDSPVLFISSHEALKFSDDDCAKLRAFAENGGLIFTHADGGTQAFNKSIAELAKRLFPQYALADLPATHPIFSTQYKIKAPPALQGISNGSRLLLVHSPEDLNKYWQLSDPVEKPVNFETGINIFIYAAGKVNLRNRLKTPVVPEPQLNPILTTTIAQVRHGGDWNPEPAGLPRFARLFFSQTSVKVNVTEVDAKDLDADKMPLAHLTGTTAFHLSPEESRAVQNYVDGGGTLLIDACGGSADFHKSMITDFFPHTFPKTLPMAMPADHPLLAGTGAGMSKVSLKLRPYRTELDGANTQALQFLQEGKGMLIYTPVDISTGLLGTETWPVNGYEPSTAYDLVRNVLLGILER